MRFKNSITLIILLFIAHYGVAQDYDFLNTNDGEYYTLVNGQGTERGFYFQVTQIFDEDTLPKNPLTAIENIISEDEIQSKLILLEPKVEFSNNTAECEIFQGPYYSTNVMIAKGTEVTFAYIIKANSKLLKKSCNIKVLSSDLKTTLREIDYFTKTEEQ
jgi:hypothetical protein